jgi:hypothetical protein
MCSLQAFASAVLAWMALSLIGGCGVHVEPKARRCDLQNACVRGGTCVDGWCVDPNATVAPDASACEPSINPPQNLVNNNSFEFDARDWRGFPDSVTTQIAPVEGGLLGQYALRVQAPADDQDFGLNDHPQIIDPAAGIGARYCAIAYVRSDTSTNKVILRLREYTEAGAQVGIGISSTVALTPMWQSLKLEYVVQSSGTWLDFQAFIDDPDRPGTVFNIDAISIRLLAQ